MSRKIVIIHENEFDRFMARLDENVVWLEELELDEYQDFVRNHILMKLCEVKALYFEGICGYDITSTMENSKE